VIVNSGIKPFNVPNLAIVGDRYWKMVLTPLSNRYISAEQKVSIQNEISGAYPDNKPDIP